MTDRAAPPKHKSSPAQSTATTCLTALLPSQPRVQLLQMTQRSDGNSSSISPVRTAGPPRRSLCFGSCPRLSRELTPAPEETPRQGLPLSSSAQSGANRLGGVGFPSSLWAEMWFSLVCRVLWETFLHLSLSPLAGSQTCRLSLLLTSRENGPAGSGCPPGCRG